MVARTLLGISPGTRIIGVAVMRRGELVEWRVKTFREHWSQDKQDAILSIIERLCDHYQVTTLSVKKVDPLKSSPQLDILQAAIVSLAERKGIQIVQYALSDLDFDVRTGKRQNKEALSEQIVNKHPALKREYLQERNNRREYYTKMFEAIAVAEASREW